MKSKKKLILFFSVTLIVLNIANIWHFLVREKESSFYPTSYATLYYPSDIPTIRKWKKIDRDKLQLTIAWTDKVNKWQILTDGTNPQLCNGNNPIFRIVSDEGQPHSYTLIPVPKGNAPEIQFTIRFFPKEYYAERGMKHTDVYIIKANVSCGKFKQYSVDYWIDDYNYVGKDELEKVDQIIHEEIGIRDDEPAFSKMEKFVNNNKDVDARLVAWPYAANDNDLFYVFVPDDPKTGKPVKVKGG